MKWLNKTLTYSGVQTSADDQKLEWMFNFDRFDKLVIKLVIS